MADAALSRDAATALFDRKLKIAESLSCRQLFVELDEIDLQIERAGLQRIDLDQSLTVAQAQAADAESLASLTVEGKNEGERKARKVQALRDDEAYQDALSVVRDLERQRAELEASTEALKRKARRIERHIDYRTSALRMFGG